MGDNPDRERLKALEHRIARMRGNAEPPPKADEHFSQANIAWRMVIELVSGLGIGLAIGLGLDAVFGTRPVFLVVFILLGFAAGVRVMMRTAREVQDGRQAGPPADKKED